MRLTKASATPVAYAFPLGLFFIAVLVGGQPIVWAGVAFFLIGIAMLGQHGLEIDPAQARMRTYHSLFGYSVGRWQPLPSVVGVTIKYFAYTTTNATPSGNSSWGIWNDSRQFSKEIVTMLSVAGSSTGIILQTYALEQAAEAVDFGQTLADQLAVPLNNYLPAYTV